MLSLYSVFSDHALFQANAALTLRGTATPDTNYTAEIRRGRQFLGMGHGTSDENGNLSVALYTPAPSKEPCTVTVSGNGESIVLEDILFGELWMATGQSNMELSNRFQPEFLQMREKLGAYRDRLRIFRNDYGDMGAFSFTPEDTTKGNWFCVDDIAALTEVSACATAAIFALAAKFAEENKDIPVGFLNVSWGGTPIYGWIPQEELVNAGLGEFLHKINKFADAENWNTYKDLNFQQTAAMYNRKIAPVRGVSVRGVLWYQGENDCWNEPEYHTYADMLRVLRAFYCEMFGADKDRFVMLSSLLYPWTYGESGETRMGYVNRAFVDTAVAESDKFLFCPIADLPPVWGANNGNHPIHPTHKYRLGERMAKLLLTNVYGEKGQMSPAYPVSCTRDGNRLLVRFASVGEGLRLCGDTMVHPLYIADENGFYIPAMAEILSEDTLAVYHPYLKNPVHCAYAFGSFEPGSTLWAGDYPVAPFATDRETKLLHIEAKPFLDLHADAMWDYMNDRNGVPYYRYVPIWKALSGSEVCFDTAFIEISNGYSRSVRVAPETETTEENHNTAFGVSVRSGSYKQLDFMNYLGLEADFYHNGTITATLRVTYRKEADTADAVVIDCPFVPLGDSVNGFRRYRADFTALPEGTIVNAAFVFTQDKAIPFHSVNIGRLMLIPKN